jgi:hypothetical protein
MAGSTTCRPPLLALGYLGGEAVGAEADDLDRVRGRPETVGLRGLRDPGVDLTALEFLDAMTLRADEVVVMAGAAEPVAALTGAVSQLVDDIALPQHRERSVDRRQTDLFASFPQTRVDLLSGRVVRLRRKRLEHEQALLRRADARSQQSLEEGLFGVL